MARKRWNVPALVEGTQRSKSSFQLSENISSFQLWTDTDTSLVPTWDPVNLMYVNTPQQEKV